MHFLARNHAHLFFMRNFGCTSATQTNPSPQHSHFTPLCYHYHTRAMALCVSEPLFKRHKENDENSEPYLSLENLESFLAEEGGYDDTSGSFVPIDDTTEQRQLVINDLCRFKMVSTLGASMQYAWEILIGGENDGLLLDYESITGTVIDTLSRVKAAEIFQLDVYPSSMIEAGWALEKKTVKLNYKYQKYIITLSGKSNFGHTLKCESTGLLFQLRRRGPLSSKTTEEEIAKGMQDLKWNEHERLCVNKGIKIDIVRRTRNTLFSEWFNPVYEFVRNIMIYEIGQARDYFYHFHTIECITNMRLEKAFAQTKNLYRMTKRPYKSIWVIHGTTPEATDAIAREGFKIGGLSVKHRHGKKYGSGIYTTTDLGTGFNYAKNFHVILCEAVLGRCGTSSKDKDVESYTPESNVYVLKKTEQVIPRFILRFSKFDSYVGQNMIVKKE